jgi:type 1 glutamine amidotransferase
VADWLRQSGYEVVVTGDKRLLEDRDALLARDLIVHNVTMDTITSEQCLGLRAAVEAGVGLGGWHGGLGDAYRDNTEFQFLVGGQFVAHPGGIIEYDVHISRPEDPVMEGVEDFTVHSEQYYLHVDLSNEVLATTVIDGGDASWVKGCVMPVVWKRTWGKGRVFYSALGHSTAEFDVPEVRTILERGLLWASR